MVGDLYGSVTAGGSTEYLEAQYVSRPNVCQQFMGWLATLGSDAITESQTTSATTSSRPIQGRLWCERGWKRQRRTERLPERQRAKSAQRLYGPGGHGTIATSADSSLLEHHGHHVDAATTAVQRWQSCDGAQHGPTSRDQTPTSYGHPQEERDGIATGCGASSQRHHSQGWQAENQGDARCSGSIGRRPHRLRTCLPRTCAKPCHLETVSTPIGPEMARVHGALSTAGEGEPFCHQPGKGRAQAGAEKSSRRCKTRD